MKMEYFCSMFSTGLLCAGLIALTPTAKADDWDKRTVVTFREPVEIPNNKVLPAGTYVIRLLGSQTDRDIVQFLNKTETHVYDTVLAIPDYREEPTSHTVVTFAERGAGSPQAIKTWFYPGDLWGDEFVYSKVHPAAIDAQSTPPPRPAVPAPPTAQPVAQSQPVPAPQPAAVPQVVEMAKAAPPPAPAPPAPQPAPANELPKTGSELPLIAILGSLAVIAGAVLNRRASA
jgi:LPXTG-motif cell wall-anchored protein